MKAKRVLENAIHGWFLLMGLVTVGCVLLISVYLIISGIPAIREIGLVKFLFGKVWDSNAATPQFGILSFILTSVYGTAGAILLGVPVGFMTAVFLAKMAPPRLKAVVSSAVSALSDTCGAVLSLPPEHCAMYPAFISKVAPSETYTPPAPFVLCVDVQL